MTDDPTPQQLQDSFRSALRAEREEQELSPEALIRRGHAAADEREAEEAERVGRRLDKRERRAARNPATEGER